MCFENKKSRVRMSQYQQHDCRSCRFLNAIFLVRLILSDLSPYSYHLCLYNIRVSFRVEGTLEQHAVSNHESETMSIGTSHHRR